MAPGSKRLNRLARQTDKVLKGGSIPPTVTNMPEGLREHYGDKYRLIFEYYDHDRCEMTKLDREDMKRVINTFAKVTKYDQTNISKLCRPDPIKKTRSGNYASLFYKLPEDFDILMELDYKGAGRIFVHLTGKMCCVVAVASDHK
jgi:hypothetical protein